MQRIAIAAVLVSALISPTVALAYSFGDWASDQGYNPGDTMPDIVSAQPDFITIDRIDSLDGIGDFDWTTTPTTSLSLSGNPITSIESGDFNGLTNLTTLGLSSNQLTSIEPGDFNGLTNLTTLWLSRNQLTSIEPGDFSGLTNLTTLWLSGNQITSIESGDFSELTNLTDLSLWNNQITSIESGDFSGLSNLTSLWLSGGNQITSIEPGDFSGLSSLTILDLGSNRITSIESGDFNGLTNLTILGLSLNQITSIEPGDFSELTNLTNLGLHGNQITSIEPGDFNGLANLTSLWLSGNQITSIESGDFSGLSNLTSLDLGSNQISSIESGAFSGLTNLTRLVLGVNEALTELNFTEADFSSLNTFDYMLSDDGSNITSASLRKTVLTQTSLSILLEGNLDGNCGSFFSSGSCTGFGEIDGITEMDLSGIDFMDITNLAPLYLMDDLTDLWLVDTQNMDAAGLDVLLDNLETIDGIATEGILYMTQADFDAFNTSGGGLLAAWHAEPGHHVAFVPEPSTSMLLAGLAAIGLFAQRGRCVA